MGQEKKYTYTVVKDQLTINEVSESTSSKITILQADRSRLVLKKEKPEMFPGKNEELYEIHFFSRE